MPQPAFLAWVATTYADLPLDVFSDGMDAIYQGRDLAAATLLARRRAARTKSQTGVRFLQLGVLWSLAKERRCVSRWQGRVVQARNDAKLGMEVGVKQKAGSGGGPIRSDVRSHQRHSHSPCLLPAGHGPSSSGERE